MEPQRKFKQRKTPESELGGTDQGLPENERRNKCALYDVDHHTLESLKGQEVYLTEVSERDSKWDAKKRQTENVSNLYSQMEDFKSQAFRTANCADRLGFNFGEDGKLKLQRAWFCRCRLCPTCQLRRQMKYTAMVYQGLPKLLEEHQGLRYLFLTLTVRNCAYEDTRSTLKWMTKSWDKMTRRKFFKTPILGFIRTSEVKKSEDQESHPHFHCILAVRPSYFKKHYIKQADWVQYWRQALKVDYDPWVDIRAINKPYSDAQGDIMDAIKETIKYAVKPGDIENDPVFLQQMTDQLHKLRFIASGGIFKSLFKKLGLEEESSADLIHLTDENKEQNDGPPVIEFAYNRDIKRYKKDPRHSLV